MTITSPDRASSTRTRTAREYLRVSLDRSGRARSVGEQHDENQRAAEQRGTALGAPFVDNSVSASRYTTKARDDFSRLLRELASGEFGADELWLWEPSRGSRRVSEWVQLIETCEDAGVSIFVTTHGRAYDPANGRDRRSLLEDAVDSEYESSKVSARAKRAAAANAAAGKPNGRVPYGYRRVYDPRTGQLASQEPDPLEAPVVRELFERLLAGHSLRSIAIDFEARGIRTGSGRTFTSQHLRDLAMRPVYVGLRVHAPLANGKRARNALEGAVAGTWEPLVSEEVYYGVRRILSDPARKTSRPGRGQHLLSFIARCDVCGGVLSVVRRSTSKPGAAPLERYACHVKGCVKVDKAELDELAVETMLTYLSDPRAFDKVDSARGGDDRLHRLRGELGKARAELSELEDSAHLLTTAMLVAKTPALEARVSELAKQVDELTLPLSLRGKIEPGPTVGQQWAAMAAPVRREVARDLLAIDWLGELRVQRRPRDAGPRRVPVQHRAMFVDRLALSSGGPGHR